MVLRLVDLFLWPLLVLIALYCIIELALGKSLRLLGNSREVLLLLLFPAYTRLQCGLALVGCVLFLADFFGCSKAPSIWSSGFLSFGANFPTVLFCFLIPSMFHSAQMV